MTHHHSLVEEWRRHPILNTIRKWRLNYLDWAACSLSPGTHKHNRSLSRCSSKRWRCRGQTLAERSQNMRKSFPIMSQDSDNLTGIPIGGVGLRGRGLVPVWHNIITLRLLNSAESSNSNMSPLARTYMAISYKPCTCLRFILGLCKYAHTFYCSFYFAGTFHLVFTFSDAWF